MNKILNIVFGIIFVSIIITPNIIKAQTPISIEYTQEQRRELILELIEVLKAKIELLTKLEADKQEGSLSLITPNGGERWVIKNRHKISWAPNPESEDIIAYLDKKNSDGSFSEVGKIIPDSRGSIYWTGEIHREGYYAQEGEYYVRLFDVTNGKNDRSDNSFSLILPEKENILSFTVNGEKTSNLSPLEIGIEGEVINVDWNTKNSKECFLIYSIDNRPIEVPVEASGSKSLFYKNNSVGIYNYLTLRCAYENATGNFNQLAYIRVEEKNGDEVSIVLPETDQIGLLEKGDDVKLFEFSLDEGGHDANLNYIRYEFNLAPWDFFEKLYVEYDGEKIAEYNKNSHPSPINSSGQKHSLAVFLGGEKTVDIETDEEIVLRGELLKNLPETEGSFIVTLPWISVQGDIESGQGYALPKDNQWSSQYFEVK